MIIPTRWEEVPDSARVIDPAGNVFHVLERTFPGVVSLRAADGSTHALSPDPQAYVPRIYDLEAAAVDTLRRHFKTEFLREERAR